MNRYSKEADTRASAGALLKDATLQTRQRLGGDCSNQGAFRSSWIMYDLGSSLPSRAPLPPLPAMFSTLTPEPPLPHGLTNDSGQVAEGKRTGLGHLAPP